MCFWAFSAVLFYLIRRTFFIQNTQLFGNWILFPFLEKPNQLGPIDGAIPYLRKPTEGIYKSNSIGHRLWRRLSGKFVLACYLPTGSSFLMLGAVTFEFVIMPLMFVLTQADGLCCAWSVYTDARVQRSSIPVWIGSNWLGYT
jgi:hypothetical protein